MSKLTPMMEQYLEVKKTIPDCLLFFRLGDFYEMSLSDNDGMPHGSGISKPTENKAVRLADRRLRLIEAELESIRIKQKLFDFIDSIEGIEGDVLYHRYIRLLKWEEICLIVHYSWPNTMRIHRRALDIVQKRIDKHEIE